MMMHFFIKNIKKLFQFKIVRYAFTGGISASIHLSIASLYIYYVDTSLLRSNIIGFLLAYIFSYTVQSKFVFEHSVSVEKAVKYFLVQFGALLLAIIVSDQLNEYNSYIKTVIVVALLPLITFVVHKFWTFNTPKGIKSDN